MKYGEKEINEARIEPWDNPNPGRDYLVELSFPEFTCLCPRSGYPDFATIGIRYVPDAHIAELKSIKLYLNSFRNRHISHEEATNLIYDEFKAIIAPRQLEVTGDFSPRGNLKTIVRVGSAGAQTPAPQ